jgi:hypothetical protein
MNQHTERPTGKHGTGGKARVERDHDRRGVGEHPIFGRKQRRHLMSPAAPIDLGEGQRGFWLARERNAIPDESAFQFAREETEFRTVEGVVIGHGLK